MSNQFANSPKNFQPKKQTSAIETLQLEDLISRESVFEIPDSQNVDFSDDDLDDDLRLSTALKYVDQR